MELEKPDLLTLVGIKQMIEEGLGIEVDVVRNRERMNRILKTKNLGYEFVDPERSFREAPVVGLWLGFKPPPFIPSGIRRLADETEESHPF